MMHTMMVFNQEIALDDYTVHHKDELISELRSIFFKKCILDLLAQFAQLPHLPPDLLGFALHLEANLKPMAFNTLSDEALSLWLNKQIKKIYLREQLHPAWSSRVLVQQKLSFLLEKLRTRLFVASNLLYAHAEILDAAVYIENSLQASRLHVEHMLKKQADKAKQDVLTQAVKSAYWAYQQACWWPKSGARHGQYLDLLVQIEQAESARAAADLIYTHYQSIEHTHNTHSFWANLRWYQRNSRWASYLQRAWAQALNDINMEFKPKCDVVEREIAAAIHAYLHTDIFYHNRARRALAYQLLDQLKKDVSSFPSEALLQRKYKMRSTLECYIQKIDHDCAKTYFFSRFYKKKRSRLSLQLEAIKLKLINADHLSKLELNIDIKLPITATLQSMLAQLKDHAMYTDIQRDFVALHNTILEAHTPHAIEVILEGHLRSYFVQAQESDLFTAFKNLLRGQDNIYFVVAIQLENALLDWQASGILPAASGYQTFLSTLGVARQNNENEIQRLERCYGIKIPRAADAMRAKANNTQQQAHALLKRVQKL